MIREAKIDFGPVEHSNGSKGVFAQRGETVIARISRALRRGDRDGIHDLRTAIRRLRTAMSDLETGISKKRARRLNRDLKAIAQLAGNVRDHDVAIESLIKLTGEARDPSVVEGLVTMAVNRRERREMDLHLLGENLSPERIKKLTEDIRELTAVPLPEIVYGAETAGSVIGERRRKFLKLVPALYDPTDVNGHHRLRIAAKHLRYSVELFDRSDVGTETAAADRISSMQDHLGNIHDCDVWIGTLRKSLKKYLKHGDEGTSDLLAAEWLLGRFVRRRATNYRSALELWAEWRNTRFLESIVD